MSGATRTRRGMTLLEVTVALTIAGAALASGAAVLGFLADQSARPATLAVVSASAQRATLRDWLS
jgi:prepilin-type N-terminal cleavage/methylation domain-containing protein